LTFSRGSIAATAAGLVAMVTVARPRALLSGMLAAAAAVPAVALAYRADLLATGSATTEATAQGSQVAYIVVACMVVAAAGRGALLRLDARLSEPRTTRDQARGPLLGLLAAGVLGLLVAVALGFPAGIQRQYDQFLSGASVNSADLRDRLTRSGDNGRLDMWQVAVDGWEQAPLRGQGAGTFALTWDRQGSGGGARALDAHSLYVETLGELGVIGLLLVLSALLLVLGGFLLRARGPDRVVGGALFGCGLAWALSAGVDWIWEMPAVTLWFFAAGGVALAGERGATDGDRTAASPAAMKRPLRLAVAIVCLVVLLVPARLYLSDRSLRDGTLAFERGDCATAVDRALDSIAIFNVRPEPHQLAGYCQARLGQPRLAVRSLAKAVHLDRGDWKTHYGLAVTRAAAALDPRPEARVARRLRPGERRTANLLLLFDTEDPGEWRRRAFSGAAPLR